MRRRPAAERWAEPPRLSSNLFEHGFPG
jgi:hypothetical protein